MLSDYGICVLMTGWTGQYVIFSRLLWCGIQERKVDFRAVDDDASGQTPTKGPACDDSAKFDTCLLVETALVTFAAVLGVRAVSTGAAGESGWLVSPLILIAAAFVPLAVRRRKLADFGLTGGKVMSSLEYMIVDPESGNCL